MSAIAALLLFSRLAATLSCMRSHGPQDFGVDGVGPANASSIEETARKDPPEVFAFSAAAAAIGSSISR